MANLYLVTTAANLLEITADFYERKDDDWVFVLSGQEVSWVKIDDVISIAKAPRDLT